MEATCLGPWGAATGNPWGPDVMLLPHPTILPWPERTLAPSADACLAWPEGRGRDEPPSSVVSCRARGRCVDRLIPALRNPVPRSRRPPWNGVRELRKRQAVHGPGTPVSLLPMRCVWPVLPSGGSEHHVGSSLRLTTQSPGSESGCRGSQGLRVRACPRVPGMASPHPTLEDASAFPLPPPRPRLKPTDNLAAGSAAPFNTRRTPTPPAASSWPLTAGGNRSLLPWAHLSMSPGTSSRSSLPTARRV